MTTKKEELIESITSRIILFCRQNRLMSKKNRNDGAISAEDFFLGLMNILNKKKGGNLVNANTLKHNYPGIDLIDVDNKTAIQVTVENSLTKIKKSFASIPPRSTNDDFSKVIFIIQDDYISKGMKGVKKYNEYDVEVFSITDILDTVCDNLEIDHMEEVCRYVEKNVNVPDKVLAEKQVDDEAFEILFHALKEEVENLDTISKAEKEYIYKSSSTDKKKKFKKDWDSLKKIYLVSLGVGNENLPQKMINYERHVNEAFSEDMDEVQKNRIIKYLNLESSLMLLNSPEEPIKALNALVEEIQKDFKVKFLSKVQIMSFVMYMFFSCDVFPILLNEIK